MPQIPGSTTRRNVLGIVFTLTKTAAPKEGPARRVDTVPKPQRGSAIAFRYRFVAAGPVSRILSAGFPAGRSFLWAGHYCPAQATYPEVVARRASTRPADSASLPGLAEDLPNRRDFLPIWSCSVWGLPCPPHRCGGGALLPHLFTLTSPPLSVPIIRSVLMRLESQRRRGGMFSVALSVGQA